MQHNDPAALTAAILHAGYLIRSYSRPHQRAMRGQAFDLMAAATREALDKGGNAEATLRAVAESLKPD